MFWNLNEIVNIEDILELLVSQHFEQVRRIDQDVMIKVEDFSNENNFWKLKFLTPFGGECKADFCEELTATSAQLQSALDL